MDTTQTLIILALVAGVIGSVIFYIHRVAANRVALEQSEAAITAESERADALEKAAVAASVKRLEEFNEIKAGIRTTDAAAALLRDALSRGRTK